MIEYIKGQITALTPTSVVLETAGVGYLLNISLPVYTALQGKAEAKLLAHEAIREDAHVLYGFLEEKERELFRLLIGVSGIGANTARMLLSSVAAAELEAVIASGDDRRLRAVKGIGTKTAQRIIVDLRDKIQTVGGTEAALPASNSSEIYDEAMAALTALGFMRPKIQKVLTEIFKKEPTITVEKSIKLALTQL
ncbi:MAG: Holliday junction branch migration protein RuvA [Muribaculaceae bacterium]|nr:Holliday junction branch migration protein RuvA [Muribaculaceae bacterium]